MAIKPSTLGLLVTAILLGGVAYLVAQQSPPTQEQAAATKLFSFEEDQIQGLTLNTGGRSLVFEKDKNKWQLRSPEPAVANEASVVYLTNLLATGMSDRTLTVPVSDKESFGLQSPLATVEIKLEDQTTHTLTLGGKNFNQTALYALVDTPNTNTPNTAKDLSLRLVSLDFENAVSRSLDDWKQTAPASPPSSRPSSSPSISPSDSPSISPANSPSPSPSARSSPNSSASPSPNPSASPSTSSFPDPSNSPSPSTP